MDRRLSSILFAVALALAVAAHFALQTVLFERIAPLWLLAAETVVAAVTAVVLTGLPARAELAGFVRERAQRIAAALGVLGLWLPQALVVTHRLSDAPSGSETVFFTTAVWALPAFAAAALARRTRPTLAQFAAALVAVLGAAAVLANWERPSSFSPLVKFPALEAWMVLGGVAFAAYAFAVARGRLRTDALALAGGGGATLVALVVALVSGTPLPSDALSANVVTVVLAGVSLGIAWWSWTQLASRGLVAEAGAALVLPVALLTSLTFVERAGTVFGPRPVLLVPAGCGAALVLLGIAGAWEVRSSSPAWLSKPTRLALLVIAAVALASGIAALFLPRIAANVVGHVSNGEAFSAAWKLIGGETAGGWFAALIAFALLARVLTRASRPALVAWALAGAIACGAYLGVANTNLRTWMRWLPPEVQQDYGTEYAQLELKPLTSWPERVAVIGSLAGLIALAALARTSENEDSGAR